MSFFSNHGIIISEVIFTEEFFDIIDENGVPSGEIISRSDAHSKGVLHRTAHVWIINNGMVLLQKRSDNKDSFPSCYDISSAGHITAGDEPLSAALRELSEELGINTDGDSLVFIGTVRRDYCGEFHGKTFFDRELAYVYIYRETVDISKLALQESEVSDVMFADISLCEKLSADKNEPLNEAEISLLKKYIREEK